MHGSDAAAVWHAKRLGVAVLTLALQDAQLPAVHAMLAAVCEASSAAPLPPRAQLQPPQPEAPPQPRPQKHAEPATAHRRQLQTVDHDESCSAFVDPISGGGSRLVELIFSSQNVGSQCYLSVGVYNTDFDEAPRALLPRTRCSEPPHPPRARPGPR